MSPLVTRAPTLNSDAPMVAWRWWRDLNGKREGDSQSGADRAALARLRRASPQAAMSEEATLRLFQAMSLRKAKLPRVATLAAILAGVRDDSLGRFGRQIGRASLQDESSAPLKLGRFKRLLEARTEEEIAAAFRRAIAIVGNKASVRDVARCVLDFDSEHVRRDLIFDYYAAGEREPAAAEVPSPTK